MKTPLWLLHLAMLFINLLRPAISFLIFCEFFYFRIVYISCLYLIYLLLDSLEGIAVFYKKEIWTNAKIILFHFNNTVFIFIIISGILLHLPIVYFLGELGFRLNELDVIDAWLALSFIIFLIVLIFGYSIQSVWGNIQNLAARSIFLFYCFLYLPWWAIILETICLASLVGIEIVKYGWSLTELRKKDLRFRRKHH